MNAVERQLALKEEWGRTLEARPLRLEWWAAVRLAAILRLQSEVRREDPERADALLGALLDHLRPPYRWEAPEDFEAFEQEVVYELVRLRGR